MKNCETLKEFIRNSILAISSGYIYYKFVQIPKKKNYKKGAILEKIKNEYQTNQTRSQLYYAKRKGFSNFKAIHFNNLILICFTNGLIKPEIDLGNGWNDFSIKNSLKVILSDYIAINIFKDERGKITANLDNLIFRAFKNEIRECFKTKNGYRFHNLLRKIHGLPKYRGFQLQKRDIVFYINELKKETGIKWSLGFKFL